MLYDPYSYFPLSTSNMSTPLATPSLLTADEAAFELEKASITSYEQGWDRWDGPVWPVGYVQCSMRELSPSIHNEVKEGFSEKKANERGVEMDGYVRPRITMEGVDDVKA